MSRISDELDHAVRVREAVPGRPEEGPYPATIDEVADEVAAWVRLMEEGPAPRLGAAVVARLTPQRPDRPTEE